MKVAFLVPSLRLSGGLNVVMEHGSRLARDHDMDVTMVITHHPDEVPWTYDGLDDVSVRTLADAAGVSVGAILEMSELASRPYPRPLMAAMAMRSEAADAVPLAGGENTYTVDVNVTFAIGK